MRAGRSAAFAAPADTTAASRGANNLTVRIRTSVGCRDHGNPVKRQLRPRRTMLTLAPRLQLNVQPALPKKSTGLRCANRYSAFRLRFGVKPYSNPPPAV